MKSRLSAHRRAGKLDGVAYAWVLPMWRKDATLRQFERDTISLVESAGLRVRNVDESRHSLDRGTYRIESLAPAFDIQKWLSDPAYAPSGERSVLDDLRIKSKGKCDILLQHRNGQEAVNAFGAYMKSIIPVPLETEGILWNVTVVAERDGQNFMLTVSAHWQLVLRIKMNRSGEMTSYIAVTSSMINRGQLVRRLKIESFQDWVLKSAGTDQTFLEVSGLDTFYEILANDDILIGARDLIFRCMQKGRSNWRRAHDPHVVDAVLSRLRIPA